MCVSLYGWQFVLMLPVAIADWTQAPGREMLPGTGDLRHSRVFTVQAKRLEFVISNGDHDWDTPDPYGSGGQKNYVVEGPGTFRLKSGKLQRLA